jgi:hypothetical protein
MHPLCRDLAVDQGGSPQTLHFIQFRIDRSAYNPCTFYGGPLPDEQMAKRIRDNIPALVLAVIAQVYEVAERRTQPWYVDRSALILADATDSVNAAIYYAEVSGWLVGAGEPPLSVAITADGVRLLEECGLI